MRQKVKIAIVCLFVSTLGLLLYLAFNKFNQKQEIAETISRLPILPLYQSDSSEFDYSRLVPGQPTLLLYFHSECVHCHYQIQDLIDHYDEMNKTNIMLLSPEPFDRLAAFAEEYGLRKFSLISVLHINPELAKDSLGATVTPTLYLYNRKGALINKVEGEIMMEAVISAIAGYEAE